VAGDVLQRHELTAARSQDRVFERSVPAAISLHAAALSSLSAPRATILSASSGGGTLQCPRLIRWPAHPHVAFFLGDQDHI